jgi:hypothetical protein
LTKESKTYTGEKTASSTGLSTCRRLKLDQHLSPRTKINSKWIKDLNVRPDTMKLPQEKFGKTLEDVSAGNYVLNRTPIAQEIRGRIDKWNSIKFKSFCPSKEIAARIKK